MEYRTYIVFLSMKTSWMLCPCFINRVFPRKERERNDSKVDHGLMEMRWLTRQDTKVMMCMKTVAA